MKWLQEVFKLYTRPIRASTKHLLIVDGHSSHVNLCFIKWASEHSIIILILPPHSTHQLQPLDLNCFSPLATKYQVYLDKWLHKSLGNISMLKQIFYKLFWPAWVDSFTELNIKGGFLKAGIWPYSPSLVLNMISCPLPASPIAQNEPSRLPPTPLTSKSICQA